MPSEADPTAEIELRHPERLRYVQRARLRLLQAPAPGLSGLQLLRATTNPRQGEWLTRLAALSARDLSRPPRVLELGTSAGISGMYLLLGLSEDRGGHLATFEGKRALANVARRNFRALFERFELSGTTFEIEQGRFDDTLPPYLERLGGPLDLVFIDGNHQREPTLRYHQQCRAKLSERGIIVHDDIAWSPGMREAWRVICEVEQRHLVVELWRHGAPSRGIVFYGRPALPSRPRFDLDLAPERIGRQVLRTLRSVSLRAAP